MAAVAKKRQARNAGRIAFITQEVEATDGGSLSTYCVVLFNGELKYLLGNDRRLKTLLHDWKFYPPRIVKTLNCRADSTGKKEFHVKWANVQVQSSWVSQECYECLVALGVPDVAKATPAPSFTVECVLGYRKQNGREEYLVKWKGYPGEDSWEPTDNFNYCPKVVGDVEGLEVRAASTPQTACEYPSITQCGGDAPRSRCCNPEAEWEVFTNHYLLHIQHALRFGWRRSRNLAGRVRRGAQTWFPKAAVDRILVGSRATMCQKGGSKLQNFVFKHPRDVPVELVGNDADCGDSCWWRAESDNGELTRPDGSAGTCMERKLLIVKGPVVFHYHVELYRLSISFDFAEATSSLWSPNWTVMRGGQYDEVDS